MCRGRLRSGIKQTFAGLVLFAETGLKVMPTRAATNANNPERIRDATQNPKTDPVQTYHLGLWFNNPKDVVNAGGPGTVTPFNGEHNAGVQVLNTSEFPNIEGPLKRVH
jgi:hypothetical protein